MDVSNCSAIITGGSSGIGEACVRQLAALGAKCVVVDLNEEKGNAVASEVGGVFVKADVSDTEQVQAAVNAATEMGPLRVLLNCAGVGMAGRTVDRNGEPFNLELFDWVLKVNLLGSFNCLRLAAAEMAKTDAVDEHGQRGAIVNLASVAAFDGQIGQCAYSASKGGVVGMTLPIARDLSSIGVRVNTVAPGLIDTPIYGEGEASEAFKESLGKNVLFPKRLGSSDELASMVIELVTNDYMNGETIRVDGGARMAAK
jgi:NAD(P)-dependent dehydrogenase (short-subunit alcohol dehydrogenase family)